VYRISFIDRWLCSRDSPGGKRMAHALGAGTLYCPVARVECALHAWEGGEEKVAGLLGGSGNVEARCTGLYRILIVMMRVFF
jgi:hypothetical protein